MSLHVLALEIALLLALAIGLSAWQRSTASTGRLSFCGLCLAIALTALGEILTLRDLVSETVADRLHLAGMMCVPALWLGFAAHVARLDVARRIPWFSLLFLAPQAVLFGIQLDDRFGALFFRTVENGDDLFGPLWHVNVAYSYVLATLGAIIIVRSASRGFLTGHGTRALWIVGAALVPLIGNATFEFGWFVWSYDPSVLMLAVALIGLRSAVDTSGLLQSIPIAPRELLHQLPLGVFLTDGNGCVIEMSDVAGNRLGVFEQLAVGRRLEDVFAHASETAPASRTVEIRQRGQLTGRLVVLD